MSRVALLDINLLVALFDSDHVHHELAHDWFADNRANGWATCPMTENGIARVLANPKYGSPVSGLPAIVERLAKFRASGHHMFWSEDVSLADRTVFNLAVARGHRQITDIYLLGLAHMKQGRLATFDRSIPLSAVPSAAPGTLAVVEAVDEL